MSHFRRKLLPGSSGEEFYDFGSLKNLVPNGRSSLEEAKIESLEQVEQVLGFTKSEIEKMNDLMLCISEIYKRIREGKPFYATHENGRFKLLYHKMKDNPKLIKYFEKTYNELSLLGAKEKIKELLNSPFTSGELDVKNLSVHIKTIIDIEPNFDFSIFESSILKKIVDNTR